MSSRSSRCALADWYMEQQRKLYPNADHSFETDPKTGVETEELRISDPVDVGNWCNFEKFLRPGIGRRSLRYKLGCTKRRPRRPGAPRTDLLRRY